MEETTEEMRDIPAKPVAQAAEGLRIHVGEEDSQIDGDICRNKNGMPGGLEPGHLPHQKVPYKPRSV